MQTEQTETAGMNLENEPAKSEEAADTNTSPKTAKTTAPAEPGKAPAYFYLLPKEEAAMRVLWDTDDALSASEIAERIPERTWPASSIQGILRNLEKKNAIKVEAITKLGKSYGRLFRPSLTSNEYSLMQFKRYYHSGKPDSHSVLASLTGTIADADKEFLDGLQKLLNEYEKKEH